MEPKKADNEDDNDDDDDIDNDLLSKEEKEEKLETKFEKCLNSQNDESLTECKTYLDKLPFSVINWVLIRTAGIERPNWNYAKTVLNDFIRRKINTLEKIEEDQEKYNKKSKKKINFAQREYSEEVYKSLYANVGGNL